MRKRTVRQVAVWVLPALMGTSACRSNSTPTTPPPPPPGFTLNPCSGPDTVNLAVDESTLVDCTNGGTTVTLAGNGASYVVVAQMPTDAVANQFVSYSLATGTRVRGAVVEPGRRAGDRRTPGRPPRSSARRPHRRRRAI